MLRKYAMDEMQTAIERFMNFSDWAGVSIVVGKISVTGAGAVATRCCCRVADMVEVI